MSEAGKKLTGRARGGAARQAKLTPEQRSENARKAALAKKEMASLPEATHAGEVVLGGTSIQCYVTASGDRVISGRALQDALRLVDEDAPPSGKKPGDRVARLLSNKRLITLFLNGKDVDHFAPVKCRYQGNQINGYRAEALADICEGMLEARRRGLLTGDRQKIVADQCEVMIRGFARVGIVALVDEATGYQKDREKDALAKILEAYVAKELQPWVKTFDAEYYENMFRLRGLEYPPENPNFRPQYFGKLTNDIVYRRLAPGVLSALKEENSKAERKGKLHQHLTAGFGRQNLTKHLGKVVALMQVSENWPDFMQKLNKVVPRYGDTIEMDLDEGDR